MPVVIDTKQPVSAPREKGLKKRPPTPLEEVLIAAQDPNEKKMGALALGLWLFLLFLICLPWWFSEATLPFAYGMPVWCVLSILAFVVIGPDRVVKKLRVNGKNIISNQNAPQIKGILSKGAPILGAKEPEAVFDPDAKESRLRVLGDALVVNEPLKATVDNNELNALAARGLAHVALGHGRRLGLIDLINHADPPILRALVWPVWLYARLLKQLWLQHANIGADRTALLLVRNPSLLLSAILKEQAANDEAIKKLDVTPQDIAQWISQKGHIGMAGEEISTQYKVGRAIHENLPLEDRLHTLQRWGESAEYKEAIEKLAQNTRRGR